MSGYSQKARDLARFRREKLGFIFQECNLLDTLTIEENIGIALTICHADPSLVRGRVHKVAEQLGIKDVLEKFPYQVSGGQKQRAACAWAIAGNQSLILADEPAGALDSKASKNLLEIMSRMNGELGATILMVTHDAYCASYADQAKPGAGYLYPAGPGKQTGFPSLFHGKPRCWRRRLRYRRYLRQPDFSMPASNYAPAVCPTALALPFQ